MKVWPLALGAGMFGGAVAVMMLPKNCTVRKAAQQAAYAVEDVACSAKKKINHKLDEL